MAAQVAAEAAGALDADPTSYEEAVALPDREHWAKAIETGEGELKRVALLPSDTFAGHTQEEFHFRLAESQFLRMAGSGGGYYVTKVRQAQTDSQRALRSHWGRES